MTMTGDDELSVRLAPMTAARAEHVLAGATSDVPNLSPGRLAALAAHLMAPLLIVGPTATGRRRMARALHATVGWESALHAATVLPVGPSLPRALFIDAAVEPADVLHLDDLVDDGATWLLLGTPTVEAVPPDLAARLGAVTIMGERLDADAAEREVRALLAPLLGAGMAPTLADELAAAVRADPLARDRDDVRRSLRRVLLPAGCPKDVSTVPLAAVTVEPVQPTGPSGSHMASGSPPSDPARVEFVLAELAHELRNPLVTLQTVTDHLDELAADEVLRRRFAGLAGEAIARMSDLLDNLVEYGRLGTPVRNATSVADLLDAALSDAQVALTARNLRVRATPGDAVCVGDPAHLTFALKNVLLGIAQTAAPDGEVVVDANLNGVVRLRFSSDADATALQRLLAPDQQGSLYDPTYQPLPFSLARTVLERGGGWIDVHETGDARTAIDVHVPVPDPVT